MARIEVQKIQEVRPDNGKSDSEKIKDVVSTFCFYYPQYSYKQALDMSIKTIRRMLKVARKEQAMNYMELLQISRASCNPKVDSYNSLMNKYRKESY